jgi:hypothetical protein
MRGLVLWLLVVVAGREVLAQPAWSPDEAGGRLARVHDRIAKLGVDAATAEWLRKTLAAYDREVQQHLRTRGELRRRMLASDREDPREVDRLLEAALASQRALVDAEQRLVASLRARLAPVQAAQLVSLLPEPGRVEPWAARQPRHDPDALFPPRSRLHGRCDPFSRMHRCPDR